MKQIIQVRQNGEEKLDKKQAHINWPFSVAARSFK